MKKFDENNNEKIKNELISGDPEVLHETPNKDLEKTTANSSTKEVYNMVEGQLQKVKKTAIEKAGQAEDFISDSYITAKIRAKILRDSFLHLFQIKVVTTDGEVELIGEVDTAKSLNRCIEIANSVKHIIKIKTERLYVKK